MPIEVFREFRISCVHLRREREALDALAEKEVAWRFLCRPVSHAPRPICQGKLCRERPFLHDRVHEVLQILMMSEVWMKAFAEDPECSIEDLPPEMQSEFKRRAEQAMGGYPPKEASMEAFKASGTIALVVQRCVKARLLVDEATDRWAPRHVASRCVVPRRIWAVGSSLGSPSPSRRPWSAWRQRPGLGCTVSGPLSGSMTSKNDGLQG